MVKRHGETPILLSQRDPPYSERIVAISPFLPPFSRSEKAMGAMKDTFIREALYQQGLMIQGKSEAHGTDGRS